MRRAVLRVEIAGHAEAATGCVYVGMWREHGDRLPLLGGGTPWTEPVRRIHRLTATAASSLLSHSTLTILLPPTAAELGVRRTVAQAPLSRQRHLPQPGALLGQRLNRRYLEVLSLWLEAGSFWGATPKPSARYTSSREWRRCSILM